MMIARGLLALFIRLAPTGIPFLGKAHLDLRIAVFATLLSGLCGVIFGLASAWERPGLASLNTRASTSRSHAFVRRSLVTVQIAVTIAPSGKVVGAEVYRSSGDPAVDKAVLTAAEKSTYSPKLVNCVPVGGTYLFKADVAP